MATSARKLKAIPKTRANGNGRDSDVHDLGLAAAGRKRIEWADKQMPVLRRLREHEPPVIGRIVGERVLLDPRTVLPDEDDVVVDAVLAALA